MAGFIIFMPATTPTSPFIPEIPDNSRFKGCHTFSFLYHLLFQQAEIPPPVHIPHKYSLPHQRQHLPEIPDHPRDSRQFPIQRLPHFQFPLSSTLSADRNPPPVHIPHKYSLPHQRQHLPDHPDHPDSKVRTTKKKPFK